MVRKFAILAKINDSKWIYYDFEKDTLYFQYFGGTNEYSYSLTAISSYGVMLFIGIAGKILDAFFRLPLFFGVLLAIVVGISASRLLFHTLFVRRRGKVEYKSLTTNEVRKIMEYRKSIFLVYAVVVLLIFLSLLLLFIQVSKGGNLDNSNFIAILLAAFSVDLIIANIHPIRSLRISGIIKQQLKEGKFDDY